MKNRLRWPKIVTHATSIVYIAMRRPRFLSSLTDYLLGNNVVIPLFNFLWPYIGIGVISSAVVGIFCEHIKINGTLRCFNKRLNQIKKKYGRRGNHITLNPPLLRYWSFISVQYRYESSVCSDSVLLLTVNKIQLL